MTGTFVRFENATRTGESFASGRSQAPPDFNGILWKKSPNPLRFRQYQQRHVEVSEGILTWAATQGLVVRGKVDFGRNPCELVEVPNSTTLFEIKPDGGSWSRTPGSPETDFTGIETGRTFVFDAIDSKFPRNKWIEVINAHIVFAKKYGTKASNPGGRVTMSATGTKFYLDIIQLESSGGCYPLKDGWELKVPKPPVPDRSTWKGVFTSAPRAILEELAGRPRYKHFAVPLANRSGEEDPETCPADLNSSALRNVMEFINYYFVLQGRPSCWYAGCGPAPLEMRDGMQTQSGLFPGHFESKCCFACPYAGTGGVADLIKNCWHTQAMLSHGGSLWMTMSSGSKGKGEPFAAPFGLRGVPIPPRNRRHELLKDPEFIKGKEAPDELKRLTSRLFLNGHGPYIITYQRPKGKDVELECGDSLTQLALGNNSRVLVHPPPGMVVKGNFQGESMGDKMSGRKGLPGEDQMGQCEEVAAGLNCTVGGPTVKVHFFSKADAEKFEGCKHVELLDLETGTAVPVWVSDAKAVIDTEYYQSTLQSHMADCGAALWVIPKPILTMNRAYQVNVVLSMKGEDPIELVWSFSTFGPRVYDVPSPFPEDSTQSLDWALEQISDMKMKPQMRSDGRPVPSVICVKAGEYHVKVRFIDPGPWLHLEGEGAEDTTIVVEAPEDPPAPTFDFPPELGLGEKGISTGFEFGWHNHDVPLFNMVQKCFWASEHDGGGADPGGWKNPERLVTMCGITLRHNVPLVIGNHGCLELVDCHIIGPLTEDGTPQLEHPTVGARIRLSEVTRQSNALFKEADLNGDGQLDRLEFRELLAKEGNLEEEQADQLLEECDLNEDGALDPREFELAYHALVLNGNADRAILSEESNEDAKENPGSGRRFSGGHRRFSGEPMPLCQD